MKIFSPSFNKLLAALAAAVGIALSAPAQTAEPAMRFIEASQLKQTPLSLSPGCERWAIEVRGALPSDRERRGRSRQWWGVTLGDLTVTLRGENTGFSDDYDTYAVRVEVSAGADLLVSRTIDCSPPMAAGMAATLRVEIGTDSLLRVFAGRTVMALAAEVRLPRLPAASEWQLTSHGKWEAGRLTLTEWPPAPTAPPDDWEERVAAVATVHTADSPVGLWEYFDRENTPELCVPGGHYRLAVIPSAKAFDIIYLEGAETNASAWHPGMRKGSLTPTPFKGVYRLRWFDAEGLAVDDETTATLATEGTTLELRFPLCEATLRMSRPLR